MNIFEKVKNILDKALNVFLILPQELDGDKLGAGLALFYTLKKLNKNVNLVLKSVPERLKFLDIPEYITTLQIKKNFTITLTNLGEEISEIYFDKEGQNLKIHFFAKENNIQEKDFAFASQNLIPDILITLGAKNLDEFGEIFKDNPQIFYDKPILNIDNDYQNENFGETNLINNSASGICEILGQFLVENYKELLDEKISTALLTGLVYATQNFQNQKTSPQLLSLASFLIERGAKHQEIIQNLFKINDVGALKLIGQSLERLTFNKEKELYLTSLTEKDFKESKTSQKSIGNVLEGLKTLSPSSLLLLWESHGSGKIIRGVFYSSNKLLLEKFSKNYKSSQKGNGILFETPFEDLKKAETEILNIL